jgi:hypothetical protein
VPADINDYESLDNDPLSYSGIVGSSPDGDGKETEEQSLEDRLKDIPESERRFHVFAHRVATRAANTNGKRRTGVIGFGMVSQIGWIVCILVRAFSTHNDQISDQYTGSLLVHAVGINRCVVVSSFSFGVWSNFH